MFSFNNNDYNSEIENNLSLKEQNSVQKDFNSIQKLKKELNFNQQEILKLRKEIDSLKEANNILKTKNLDLINLIKSYKLKESKALMTEENLKAMRQEYDSLKDSLLKDRSDFQMQLREKDNIYNADIIQTNLRAENLKHQSDTFNGIKKLNDILYIKNNELLKNIEDLKNIEKTKLEALEIRYNKKMNNYKRKMIEFLKRNEKERAKNGTQGELNNKLNILHIQELVNEVEIQGVEVEDLLKERQELKFKILELNRDLNIYQKIIDLMKRKNNTFQNKLKNINNNNNIQEYNSLSSNKKNKFKEKSYNLLTEPDKNPLNINVIKLTKNKFRGYTHNEKVLKIIKDKYIIKKEEKKLLNQGINEENKERIKNKENNNDINNKSFKYYKENKNRDNIIEFLFREREKYKESAQFYKNKLDLINNRFSNIMKMYNEALEKIYKEELDKNIENIILNINDFKTFDFQQMKSEQKYAILIKLINSISGQNSTKIPSQISSIINLKTMSNKNMKDKKTLGSFSDYKKFIKNDNKNRTLYKFSNSKISIDLLPKVDLLDL